MPCTTVLALILVSSVPTSSAVRPGRTSAVTPGLRGPVLTAEGAAALNSDELTSTCQKWVEELKTLFALVEERESTMYRVELQALGKKFDSLAEKFDVDCPQFSDKEFDIEERGQKIKEIVNRIAKSLTAQRYRLAVAGQ